MKTTTNLGLKKIELTDSPPDITVQDTNWDSIDKHLNTAVKFQKAGGTGTAITLSEVTLEDGFQKTFIVTANNSSAATKINGKNLYKPGGTAAPNLITGKAVTVWYDLAGDCFFIKASAEGDAIAANVLAGKKFSNDNDTGITGTMPSKAAETYTPGTANQTIAAGQYLGGIQTIKGDANLVAANIKGGTSIFGVQGKGAVVDTGTANATNKHLIAPKTAFINGVKVTGVLTPKFPNLIKNGGFEQDLMFWEDSVNCEISAVASSSGSKGLRAFPFATRAYCGIKRTGVEFAPNANSKYYMSGWFNVMSYNAGSPVMMVRAITEGVTISVPIDTSAGKRSTWQFLSLVFDTTGWTLNNVDYFAIHDNGVLSNIFDIFVDNLTLINLTDAFGVGKELTQSEMDALISPTWYDSKLSDLTSDTNAVAADMLTGKTAIVKGAKITGSIPIWSPNVAGTNQHVTNEVIVGAHTPNDTRTNVYFRVPHNQYNNGTEFVVAYAPDLKPENILSGKNILGVWGNIPKMVSGTAVVASNEMSFVTAHSYSISNAKYIAVSGLTFKPRTILVRFTNAQSFGELGTMVLYKENVVQPGRGCILVISGSLSDGNAYSSSAPNPDYYKRYHTSDLAAASYTPAKVTATEFCLPLPLNVSAGAQVTWLALDLGIGG